MWSTWHPTTSASLMMWSQSLWKFEVHGVYHHYLYPTGLLRIGFTADLSIPPFSSYNHHVLQHWCVCICCHWCDHHLHTIANNTHQSIPQTKVSVHSLVPRPLEYRKASFWPEICDSNKCYAKLYLTALHVVYYCTLDFQSIENFSSLLSLYLHTLGWSLWEFLIVGLRLWVKCYQVLEWSRCTHGNTHSKTWWIILGGMF